jgi:glycosyltransferase involved in cell wall biosynthesis
MKSPKVTVICTCYNQEAFVEAALDSVPVQEGVEVELFIIDNGSTDRSQQLIQRWADRQEWLIPKLILRDSTINYCKSFNEALLQSSGEYVVDLSGDDVLLDLHLYNSVRQLEKYPEAALSFSDVLVEEKGKTHRFYVKNRFGPPVEEFGDVYEKVIYQYCISTVSMVFSAEKLKSIGGYDEELVYEDFDVLCRLAREYPFAYGEHVGVKKRIHANAYSRKQYRLWNSEILRSTLKVCQKIQEMNRTEEENRSLRKRALHEAKHALLSGNFAVGWEFLKMVLQMGARKGAKAQKKEGLTRRKKLEQEKK